MDYFKPVCLGQIGDYKKDVFPLKYNFFIALKCGYTCRVAHIKCMGKSFCSELFKSPNFSSVRNSGISKTKIPIYIHETHQLF